MKFQTLRFQNTAWSGADKIGKNASKCKLKMLSAKKECLEKSQSYEAFRSCMAQFREQRRQEMRVMKQRLKEDKVYTAFLGKVRLEANFSADVSN
jgi:hypothetical protein